MDIDDFKTFVSHDAAARIHICHGPPRCDGKSAPCQWCEIVFADDGRTTDEILAGMKEGQ